jgi:hypothetical protein
MTEASGKRIRRDRAASWSDRQMQRLTLAQVTGIDQLGREHQRQRVDDVCACLLPRSALAEDAGNLGDRHRDPAVVARLVDDRQIEDFAHTVSVSGSVLPRPFCPQQAWS